jgi:hypothetical protein
MERLSMKTTTELWNDLVDALEPLLSGRPLSRQEIAALEKAHAASLAG